jgi:hypothetical protein
MARYAFAYHALVFFGFAAVAVSDATPTCSHDSSGRYVVPQSISGRQTCSLGKRTVTVSWRMMPGMPNKCVWTCSPAKPNCLEAPGAGQTQSCACKAGISKPHLTPISESVETGQSGMPDNMVPERVCSKKQLGDIVGVEVNCGAIKVPYQDLHLVEVVPGRQICTLQQNPQAGKLRDFLFALPLGSAICNYKCQRSALSCTDGGRGDVPCECATSLVPRLVVKSMPRVLRAVQRDDGSSEFDDQAPCVRFEDGLDSCGPCGTCAQGTCLPKRNMLSGNYCDCGFVCPHREEILSRTVGLGSPIECVRNPGMEGLACGGGVQGGTGMSVPDICKESDISDALDECACHESKREVLGLYTSGNSGNKCVSKT